MNPDRARELLGGLAAGILTPEERATLFEAALHDQALFNEVADELEFAAFLQSPETRAQLANRIEVEPERRRWWALRPAWLALSGVLAASTVLFVVLWHRQGQVVEESVVARQNAPLSAMSAPESAVKQPATVLKPAPKPESARTVKRAAVNEIAQAAQPADRPEPSNQHHAEQIVAASGAAPAARAAAPMMPLPPPPQPEAPAPVATASLTGTVHDAAGAVVPGATVDILNTLTNATTHTTSDANGRFVASLPQGGPYTVTVVAAGFQKEQRSGITLAENQPAQIDLPLSIGQTSETVMVAAAAPPERTMMRATKKDETQNLTQVAVLDFVNGAGQNLSGAQVADQLSSQLGGAGQLRVIDREKVQQAAQSQNANGHPPTAQEAAALGRSIGADAVIMGSVQPAVGSVGGLAGPGGALAAGKAVRKAVSNVSVTAEIIDTKQAKPPVTLTAGGASLQVAASELGDQIQSRLVQSVEGKVTHQSRDVVSVEFVSPPGLAIGARCDVIRGTRKIGELVITSVNGQSALGKYTGAGRPRTGDRVTVSR